MIKRNILTITVTVLIIYLSLAPADDFENVKINVPYLDKFIHFLMYMSLMAVIIFEHRKSIRDKAHVFLRAIFPVCLGIILEILQKLLEEGRSGDIYDGLANFAGVVFTVSLWFILRKRLLPLFR